MTNSEIIKLLIDSLGETQYSFAKKVGIPQSSLSMAIRRNSELSSSFINKIAIAYPQVNTTWLLTGEGEMLKGKDTNSIINIGDSNVNSIGHNVVNNITEKKRPKIESNVTPVPEGEYMMVEYADLRASAGRLGGADVSQLPETHRRLVPKEYAKGGFLVIRVDGDSMDDGSKRSLSDGDEVLVYEKTDNHLEDLPIKKTLFVITSRDGNVLKQIKEINKEEGYIVCHSFNPRYEDYKMHISDIYQIFIVCKVVQKQISLI